MDFFRENKSIILCVYLILWGCISLLTFLLYKIDKTRAKKHRFRIRESILLVFPWLLGSGGGILGVYLLRHKTRHWYFCVNNILAFLIQLALFLFIVLI